MKNIIIFLFVMVGFLLYFFDDLIFSCRKIFKKRNYIFSLLFSYSKKLKKKRTLKYYVDKFEKGKQKDNFVISSFKLIDNVFNTTDRRANEKEKIKRYKKICFFCGIGGFFIALILKNLFLVPVLSLGFGLLPMWLLRFRRYKYTLKLTDELSVALSTISSSYIRSGKIISAVKENLCYLKSPIKQSFERFIQNCNINPDIKSNLNQLKGEIDNKVFRLWVDNVIASQDDFHQSSALNAVVEQFSAEKSIYNELKTEMQQPITYYLAMLFFTFISFPIAIQLGNAMDISNIGNIMLETFTGQALITIFAIASFWGINKAIKLSTSLDEID